MIYDCFPFNNELTLLEIRLNHHNPFVDKFILSESLFTYSGLPKKLYYYEVRDQEPFVKFKNKIIHRIYSHPPNGRLNWEYEHAQRNSFLEMMSTFKETDLILYLDCDEMIRDEFVIEEAKKLDEIITLQLKHNWYYFNCMKKPGSEFHKDYSLERCFVDGWYMGKICRKRHLAQFRNLYNLRESFLWNRHEGCTILNAGWHFSNLGNSDTIYNKLMSFSHSTELSVKYDLSSELIQKRKEQLLDPLGRKNVSFIATALDVPQFVLDNVERYSEYILDVSDS